MKKFKKIRFTLCVFVFAIGISVFSTPAVAGNDITATVPVQLRNVHPDIVECYIVVQMGGLKEGGFISMATPDGRNVDIYATGVTQLDYDPSGNGSFDGDVVVTVDLRQVSKIVLATIKSVIGEQRGGRKSTYAYEDLKAENFTHYRVRFIVYNSDGISSWMYPPGQLNAKAWTKFKWPFRQGSGTTQEIVKD